MAVCQVGLTLLLGCALACLASSEVVQLEDEQAGALELGKEEVKAEAASKDLQHGNTLQMPEDRDLVKKAPKGSLAGEADPGYGPASASRTDFQRAHEEEEQKRADEQTKAAKANKVAPPDDPLEPANPADARVLERSMYRRVNGMAGQDSGSAAKKEISRSRANREAIRRKAKAIKAKLEEAKTAVQEAMDKAAADALAEEEKAKEQQENAGKEKTPEEVEKDSIEAEQKKLRAADHAALGSHYAEGGLFDKNEPIATHKSGNWVDKTNTPNLRHYRPKNHKDPASWREKGDTPEAQKKP